MRRPTTCTLAAATFALIALAARGVDGQLLRGSALNDGAPHRQLPPLGLALNEGQRDAALPAEVAEDAQLQAPLDTEHHRVLPPMSHGWALEGAPLADISKQAAEAATGPEHRALQQFEAPAKEQEQQEADKAPMDEPDRRGPACTFGGLGCRRVLQQVEAPAAATKGQEQQEGDKAPVDEQAQRGPACVFGGLGCRRALAVEEAKEQEGVVAAETVGDKVPTEDQDRRGPACVFGGLC